jgi:imidazolonepropionase-like amidohydrolase
MTKFPYLKMLMLAALIAAPGFASDSIPGPAQKKPVAIKGATVHPISSPAIEGATIVFDKGKITAVAKDAAIPEGADVVDATGKHIYPGLIDAHNGIGLTEIDSIRATIDRAETGQFNPNVKARWAFNPDSEIIPVTRANGVLIAVATPSGGIISGMPSAMQLDGWTWEDMTLAPEIAMLVNWPAGRGGGRRGGGGRGQRGAAPAGPQDDPVETLKKYIEKARTYDHARNTNPSQGIDAKLEAMRPVLAGKMPIMVAAEDQKSIQAAVAFAAENKFKLIIYGGYDAESCAELLKKNDVPVIVGGIYRLGTRESDAYDISYTLPERLRAAGVKFCITGSGRFEASNVRNLPYHAATAVGYGLPVEEGLRSITLSAAEILGIADKVGSLDVGKHATLFVSTGNPLETETQVEAAWIGGRKVDLSSKHTRLNEKYKEKFKQLAP